MSTQSFDTCYRIVTLYLYIYIYILVLDGNVTVFYYRLPYRTEPYGTDYGVLRYSTVRYGTVLVQNRYRAVLDPAAVWILGLGHNKIAYGRTGPNIFYRLRGVPSEMRRSREFHKSTKEFLRNSRN